MINMKRFLTEDRNASTDKGCLMAMVDNEHSTPLNKFGEKLIAESSLYKVGNEFGRERDCHCTIRYGFFPDLNELQLRRIIGLIKPFDMTIIGIDKFENHKEGFDVVKFTIESDVLRQLNMFTKQFPNEDKYASFPGRGTSARSGFLKPHAMELVKSMYGQMAFADRKSVV